MGRVLRLLQILQRAEILLNSRLHDFCVHEHIILERVFEGDDLELRLFPLLLNRKENFFVLALCFRMVYDQSNVITIIPDVVLA